MTRVEKAKRDREIYEAKCHDNDMSGGKTLFGYVKDAWAVAEDLEEKLVKLELIARSLHLIATTGYYDQRDRELYSARRLKQLEALLEY